MREYIFSLQFLETSYQGFYIREPSSAILAISKLMEKDVLFGIDTETEPLPFYRHITKAGLSPHLSCTRLLQIFDGVNSLVFDLKFLDPKLFVPFLNTRKFIAHNALFDLQYFKLMGADNMNIGCTMILARLLFHACYPTDAGLSASLANLAEKILGTPVLKKLQISDWSMPDLTHEQIEYAALDSICVMKLAEKLSKGLTKFGLERVYTLDKAVQHPVADMQLNGIGFDIEKHRILIMKWREELISAQREVEIVLGSTDLSPTNIRKYLEKNVSKEMLLLWMRTEEDRLLSLDANAFLNFSHLPVVKPFARYKKLEKLTSTYGVRLIHQVNPVTEKIHAHYNTSGARTGRFSSSDPNLQNMAKDSGLRGNFIPTEGNIFIHADFNQIELRVAAELSRDKVMLQAYKEGTDLHALTASAISHKPLSEVTDGDRQLAKAFNFGLLFGLGVKKFSHYAKKSYGVEVSEEEAIESIAIFRSTYSGYREWQLEQANNAGMTFHCRTPCGKLRRLPEDNTFGNSMNTPVQGGAAESMKYALVHLRPKLLGIGKLINCVHDDILIEAPKENIEQVTKVTVDSMTKGFLDVFPGAVTNKLVKVGVGNNWAEAK